MLDGKLRTETNLNQIKIYSQDIYWTVTGKYRDHVWDEHWQREVALTGVSGESGSDFFSSSAEAQRVSSDWRTRLCWMCCRQYQEKGMKGKLTVTVQWYVHLIIRLTVPISSTYRVLVLFFQRKGVDPCWISRGNLQQWSPAITKYEDQVTARLNHKALEGGFFCFLFIFWNRAVGFYLNLWNLVYVSIYSFWTTKLTYINSFFSTWFPHLESLPNVIWGC